MDLKIPAPPQQGTMAMESLIGFIAKELAAHPDQVSVRGVENDASIVIQLKVDKTDLGKIIGKQGRTSRALRTLISAASARAKKRTVLEIIE